MDSMDVMGVRGWTNSVKSVFLVVEPLMSLQ